MKLKLAIVILNWNGKAFLEKFLPVLLLHTPDYAEIIIADNASSDGSMEMMKMKFPEVKTIQNSCNGGFSKGYNEALQKVDADYYCLLNSDVEVTENWVSPIMTLLDEHPDVAAVQPKLLSYYERDSFEYAGASGGFVDRFGYPFCRGRLFEIVERDQHQYDDIIETFWATGAALFVRSELYHKIGGLDEDFFAHMEEIDFCWRLKNLGYKVMVNPLSKVYHVGGGTLPKENSMKTYLNFRNNHFLLIKNLPENRLILTFFMRFFLDIAAAFLFLSRGNKKDFV
ncbi:MAG: glycosyltransferase family 2 protein, partial [Bacteroidales bacterium]|nr:glycosyltransferase family 2 protein [Bacteroidales bacterium]